MIRGYVGGLGGGKTLRMVDDARILVKTEKRAVYTNMSGLRFPEAIYIPDVASLQHISRGVVLLDEAAVSLSSRAWQSIDPEVLSAFRQARKHGLDLYYTSQGVEHVDKIVREITNEVSVCRKIGRGDRPSNAQTRYGAVRYSPDMKRLLGRRLVRYSRETYALYGTFEKISRSGGGGAEGDLRDFPLPLYAKLTQEARGKRDGYVYGDVFNRSAYRWFGRRAWLTRNARKALEWLRTKGYLQSAVQVAGTGDEKRFTWVEIVERELARRAWLGCFGLGPDDAPYTCRFDTPWAYGFDPKTVKARRDEEIADQLARELAIKAAAKSGRSATKGGVSLYATA